MSHMRTFFLIVFSIIFLVMIPAYALDQNGVIELPFTENPPIIDGRFSSTNEWSDASSTFAEKEDYGFTGQMHILTKHDREFVYILLDVISFQYDPHATDRTTGYLAVICFDTNNNGGLTKNDDDLCFESQEVYSSGTFMPQYSFSNVLKGESREGFPLPRDYVGKWGFGSTNDPYEGGRDHLIYEVRIPIAFLHKSDQYGFHVLWNGGSDLNSDSTLLKYKASWPTQWGTSPSEWGTLSASKQTVTAPPIPVLSISQKPIDFGNVAVSEKSSPKTITISNVGTATLKITGIRTSGDFSIKSQPLMVLPNTDMTFDVVFAPLTVGEKSGVITISSNDLSHPTMTIDVKGTGTEKGKGCLIATAAYGSELAPQVQMLREIRDNMLFSTSSGAGFMTSFNALYYSFSPTVADWERENPAFKEAVKVTITPMLSTLSILNYVNIDSEQEMLGYGIGIILLNLGMYFVVPAIVILKIRSRWTRSTS